VNADGTFSIEIEPTSKMLTLIFTASGTAPPKGRSARRRHSQSSFQSASPADRWNRSAT